MSEDDRQAIDYLAANVASWQAREVDQLEFALAQWALDEPRWGIFAIPESHAGVLPDSLEGLRAAEIGCGTAYVSCWMARRGASPVALDPTPTQLSIARRCQERFGLSFPLFRGVGEELAFREGSFDFVISEYGAAIWADPYRWIPEAARVLRPGGQLVFLGNSTLLMMCAPDDENEAATAQLLRPQFGMHRFEWPGDPTVEFHLGHGDWIRLFGANGLVVEDLVELRPPVGSSTEYPFVTLEWARQWPCEEVWKVRKVG